MKYEIELDLADSVFIQFLRHEAETVWEALRYLEKLEASGEAKEYELVDLRYNWQLLGAMYLVEEYFSEEPILREKYPRENNYDG